MNTDIFEAHVAMVNLESQYTRILVKIFLTQIENCLELDTRNKQQPVWTVPYKLLAIKILIDQYS